MALHRAWQHVSRDDGGLQVGRHAGRGDDCRLIGTALRGPWSSPTELCGHQGLGEGARWAHRRPGLESSGGGQRPGSPGRAAQQATLATQNRGQGEHGPLVWAAWRRGRRPLESASPTCQARGPLARSSAWQRMRRLSRARQRLGKPSRTRTTRPEGAQASGVQVPRRSGPETWVGRSTCSEDVSGRTHGHRRPPSGGPCAEARLRCDQAVPDFHPAAGEEPSGSSWGRQALE